MARCVDFSTGSALVDSGPFDPEVPCSLVLMTASEFTSAADFGLVFGVPESEHVVSAFMAGIGLPLTLWLVAWAFGTVIRFASHN